MCTVEKKSGKGIVGDKSWSEINNSGRKLNPTTLTVALLGVLVGLLVLLLSLHDKI